MDGLWDPPNYQATEDTDSFCLAYGDSLSHCPIYSTTTLPNPAYAGYEGDVIEETAFNEKSCIQVLSILIGKADNDIVALEEDLMDLVTQLACTDEEFSDMFCTTLRVKTDFLDLSIRKLNDDAQDFSSTSREPAESISDILKSLFCCYLRKKDQQFADNTTVSSSSYHQVHSGKLSGKKKRKDSSSNANQTEKSTSVMVTPLEKHMISLAKVKVEEEDADYPCMTLVSKYSSQCLSRASMQNMNKEGKEFQIKSPIMTKDILNNKTTRCKSICQKSSLKTKGKWNHQLKMVKSQPEDESIGSTSICLVESSQKPKAKQNITKELGFSLANPEDHQEPKASLFQSLYLLDSSQKPNVKQNITKELGFCLGNSNPEEHQEPKALLSQSLYSTKTYKRRCPRLSSPTQTSSSSLLLLEEPKPLRIHIDVANLHDMDYYTVDDLKVIAKQRNLKGYYKLRKAELAELLGIKVTEGKRKQKRKETLPSSTDEGCAIDIAA